MKCGTRWLLSTAPGLSGPQTRLWNVVRNELRILFLSRGMRFYRGFMKKIVPVTSNLAAPPSLLFQDLLLHLSFEAVLQIWRSIESMVVLCPESLNSGCFPRHLAVASLNAVSQVSMEKCPALCVRRRSPSDVKQKTCKDIAFWACCAEGS